MFTPVIQSLLLLGMFFCAKVIQPNRENIKFKSLLQVDKAIWTKVIAKA